MTNDIATKSGRQTVLPQMISESSRHGGARPGAGRKGYRAKVEDCSVSLDIRQIYPGAKLRMTWPAGPSFEIDCQPDALIIAGSLGREWTRQCVPIVQTACHFGGARSWFECSACSARAARLFFRGTRFACRKCSRLVYASGYAPRKVAP